MPWLCALASHSNKWPTAATGSCRGSSAGAENFTTVELKSNFLGTARAGTISCAAMPVHLGNTTQIWDAVVSDRATGKKIALFRCTQMVLWPRNK